MLLDNTVTHLLARQKNILRILHNMTISDLLDEAFPEVPSVTHLTRLVELLEQCDSLASLEASGELQLAMKYAAKLCASIRDSLDGDAERAEFLSELKQLSDRFKTLGIEIPRTLQDTVSDLMKTLGQ